MTSSDELALDVFERKILRKIYESFCDRGEWRIRWNQEDIYDDIDIVKRVKYSVFDGWVKSLVWIAPTQFVKSSNLIQVVVVGGRPRQRWAEQVNENVTTLGQDL